MPNPDLLTTRQAAEQLHRSVRTVHRFVRDGRLAPAMKIDGHTGALLFKRSDVQRLAREMAA